MPRKPDGAAPMSDAERARRARARKAEVLGRPLAEPDHPSPAASRPPPPTDRELEIELANSRLYDQCSHCGKFHGWRMRCVGGKFDGLSGPEAMDLFRPGAPLEGCTDSRVLTTDQVQAAARKMRKAVQDAAHARHVERESSMA